MRRKREDEKEKKNKLGLDCRLHEEEVKEGGFLDDGQRRG